MTFESEKELLSYACDKFLEVIEDLDKEKLDYVFVKKIHNENLHPGMFLVFENKNVVGRHYYRIIIPRRFVSYANGIEDLIYYEKAGFSTFDDIDFETLSSDPFWGWSIACGSTQNIRVSDIVNNRTALFAVLDVYVCSDCGKLSYNGGSFTIRRKGLNLHVCSECYNKYKYCVICGEYKLKEDFISLSDGCEVCSDCFKNSDLVTEDCLEPGQFIIKSRAILIEPNKYTTTKSLNAHKDLVFKCSLCGRYYFKDDTTKRYGRHYICGSCLSDKHTEIKGYHYNPKRVYFGEKGCSIRPRKFKGFGIELEVQKSDPSGSTEDARCKIKEILGDDPYQELYFMRDGSIGSYGFEIITQPHEEKSLLKINWEKILSQLKSMGYRSHNGNACGLHIHSSRNLYGDTKEEQNDNIAKVIYFYEKNFDDLFKFSRRTETSWCHSYRETLENNHWLRSSYDYDGKITKDACKKIVRNNGLSRYHAVNVTNRNTIEFRIFRGTLILETFLSTLDLTFNIVRNCKNISWEEIDDVSKWLSGINDTTKEYIKSRNCFEGVIK